MPDHHSGHIRSWRRLIGLRVARTQDLRGKCIIVTGASPGSIGHATARCLAHWGARVVITARHLPTTVADQLNTELNGKPGTVQAAALDLSQAESVADFVRHYRSMAGERLDILVNNAGIHLDLLSRWTAPRLTEDAQEIHWRVNYLGSFDLTQQLLPLLLQTAKTTGDARVITVVSQLHNKGKNAFFFRQLEPYNSWVAYGLSKLALVHMSQEIQRRFSQTGLSSCSLHPGGVYSAIAGKGLEEAQLLSRLRNALSPVEKCLMLTPAEGSQTSLFCATDPAARQGGYYRNCQLTNASPESQDLMAAKRLWDATLNWQQQARTTYSTG